MINKMVLKTAVTLAILLVFGLGIYVGLSEPDQDQKARAIAQQKWAQNNLFLNTLNRYNEVYHGLKRRRDKEALAVAYLSKITKDLFLFPSKDGAVNVILPDVKVNAGYVLQEIKVGPDNGLYTALHYMLNRYKGGFKPSLLSSHTALLMEYIITEREIANELREELFVGVDEDV